MTKQWTRLTDSQWAQVKEYLPVGRKGKYDLKDVLDAVLWMVRTGTQWRNLPDQFPPYRSVFYYFNKWSRDKTIEAINDGLNRLERKLVHGREDTPSQLLVDAQSVRLTLMIGTHRGIDGGKWVNGRKRSILTDTLGRTWRVNVHATNVHDGIAGCDLIYPDFKTQMPRAQKLLGDNAYRGEFAKLMGELDEVKFEYPSRAEGSKGFVVEVKRWVVERSFAWMNFYRRVTKDLERTVENSASWILLANIKMVISSIHRRKELNFQTRS